MLEKMGAQTLVSVEEYLSTSYSPDREYRDGVLVERNVGTRRHGLLQIRLGSYFNRRRKQWQIEAYTETRIRVREDWYPIPDICVYTLPAPEEDVPTRPPLLWIEILSPDDRMPDVWHKANELLAHGVPYVWIIDPETLDSELRTQAGIRDVPEKTLRLPDSPIVVPLVEVMEE
ncbi:MAG TPA: Uma2 family endonuclease [Bryobacteraceae bacterium]|nr:Uma2 family endonuclease [Bryobacteraceae bacterium]